MGRRLPGSDRESGVHAFLVSGFHGARGVPAVGWRNQGGHVFLPHGRSEGPEEEDGHLWVRAVLNVSSFSPFCIFRRSPYFSRFAVTR